MSTATVTPPPAPTASAAPLGTRCVLTIADLARFPRLLPSGEVRWELYDGVPVPMSPPGYVHGKAALKIAAQLLSQGEERGYGEAGDEIAVVLRRNPDRVVGVDALFVAKASLPAQLSPEGYLLTIPALVLEVRSKNDTQPEVDAKVQEYLAAGVVLVWVADPDARTVTAYRANQPATAFTAADTLTADGVIPGFAVPVANLLPTP